MNQIFATYAAGLITAIAASSLVMASAATAQNEIYVPVETKEVNGYLMVHGVNSRTGNFAITYPAFEAHGVPYRRTYNSNADNRGTFGAGWGSSFDTRAVSLPDGRVAVLENGNGAITVYGPLPKRDMRPQTQANGQVVVPLSEDRWETREEMEQLVTEALAHPGKAARPDIGTKLSIESPYAMEDATLCGDGAVLAIMLRGYIRTTCADRMEFFDEDGRLVRFIDTSGSKRTVEIARSATGQITAVSDNEGHLLRFTWTAGALTVTDETGASVTYAFDAAGRNTRIGGPGGPSYTFDYTPDGRLEAIVYIDGTSLRLAYDKAGRTAKLTTREQDVYEFSYDPASSKTLIIRRPFNGEPTGMIAKFVDP